LSIRNSEESSVRLERGAQGLHRVVESGFGGAHRDAQGLGDLGEWQAQVVVQDDDSSLLWLQAPEASLKLVAIGQRPRAVIGRRLDRDDPDLGRPASLMPTLVGTGVDDKPMEPRPEAVRIT